MVIGGESVEVCERHGVTACPMTREEWNHTPTQQPQGPSFTQSYVLGTGTGTGAGMVSPIPSHFFAGPQNPEFPYTALFYSVPRMSAAHLYALQQRRYPVVVEGTWRSVFEPHPAHDPAPKTPEQMKVGSFTPAAHLLGPMQGVGMSASVGIAALTLTDANGVDVTSLHRV